MKLSELNKEQQLRVALPMKVGYEKAIKLMDEAANATKNLTEEEMDKSVDIVIGTIRTTVVSEILADTIKVLDNIGVDYVVDELHNSIEKYLMNKTKMYSLSQLLEESFSGVIDEFEETKCVGCPKYEICKAESCQNPITN